MACQETLLIRSPYRFGCHILRVTKQLTKSSSYNVCCMATLSALIRLNAYCLRYEPSLYSRLELRTAASCLCSTNILDLFKIIPKVWLQESYTFNNVSSFGSYSGILSKSHTYIRFYYSQKGRSSSNLIL